MAPSGGCPTRGVMVPRLASTGCVRIDSYLARPSAFGAGYQGMPLTCAADQSDHVGCFLVSFLIIFSITIPLPAWRILPGLLVADKSCSGVILFVELSLTGRVCLACGFGAQARRKPLLEKPQSKGWEGLGNWSKRGWFALQNRYVALGFN